MQQLSPFSSPDFFAIHPDSSACGRGLSPALQQVTARDVAWNQVPVSCRDKMPGGLGARPRSLLRRLPSPGGIVEAALSEGGALSCLAPECTQPTVLLGGNLLSISGSI